MGGGRQGRVMTITVVQQYGTFRDFAQKGLLVEPAILLPLVQMTPVSILSVPGPGTKSSVSGVT